MNNLFFEKYFDLISDGIRSVKNCELVEASEVILGANRKNGKIIIVGNGGSAAIASHVSVDFTKACEIRAVNFNEADLITCFANDYGYENWVVEAIKAYADPNDLVILISSSGESKNIINAAHFAKKQNLKTITFSGFSASNQLRKIGDINFWVGSNSYNVVEMTHHIWLLAIVDFLIMLLQGKEK